MSTMRVYVKKSIKEAKGFPLEKLALDKGCSLYYAYDFGLEDKDIPQVLKDHLVFISFHDCFTRLPDREIGIYRYGGVRATLDLEKSGRNSGYELRMRSRSIKQLRNAYEKIRAGKLRPSISFRGKQSGKSRQEIETENEQLKSKLDLMKENAEEARHLLSLAQDCKNSRGGRREARGLISLADTELSRLVSHI